MTTTKKGDFIELDFVGRVKSTNRIFDLTIKDIAEKEGIYSNEGKYEPMIACLGASHLIKCVDEQVTNKEVGIDFEFDLTAENAFGRKNPKLIQLTSLAMFKKKNIMPMPGLQLDIDGALATVRSVSGGRVIIDFNHPLAGKELHYWVKIRKIITDKKEKVEAIIKLLGVPCTVSFKEKVATIKMIESIPEQMQKIISEEIKKQVSDIEIKFSN
jgi:peptidylprolyl isomerase